MQIHPTHKVKTNKTEFFCSGCGLIIPLNKRTITILVATKVGKKEHIEILEIGCICENCGRSTISWVQYIGEARVKQMLNFMKEIDLYGSMSKTKYL